MKHRLIASFGVALMLAAGSAWAHHNMSAAFDFDKRVALSGTLNKVDWTNPHIHLFVDAKQDGQLGTWSLEGPSPAFFRARNLSKEEFASAVGQAVTAEASRARDGSMSGLLREFTLPGGKVISLCPQNC